MAITHTATLGIASSAGGSVRGNSVEVGSNEVTVDEIYPAGTTNQLQAAVFAVANVQSCILLSDKNLTIKTNSSGSPANTINLVAGVAYIWLKSEAIDTLKFTVDVTAWYITCAATARLQAKILVA